MRIVFLSNVPDGGTFKLGSHHLARELAELGNVVAHVSTPVSWFEIAIGRDVRGWRFWKAPELSDEKRTLFRRRVYRDPAGVHHSAPRPLLPVRWVPRSRAIRCHLRTIGFANADVVVLDQVLLEAAVDNLTVPLVYRPTDNIPAGKIREAQSRLLARASAVVAPSPFTMESLGDQRHDRPRLVLENGVDSKFFVHDDLPRHGVVYVGAIDYRFDWQFVISAAKDLPGTQFTIAGPYSAGDIPPQMPENVRLLGPVPYTAVPALLARAQVGLLPLTTTETNKGRSPMKFYEYMASQLYVVASNTPALAARHGVPGLALVDNAEDALIQIRTFLGAEHSNREGAEFARQFDWRTRAREFVSFLESTVLA